MSDSAIQVVFIDVDGTLIEARAWIGILRYRRVNQLKVAWLYLSTLPRWILRRGYLISRSRFRAGWIRGLAGLLRNWRQSQAQDFFMWLADEYLKNYYQPAILDLIKQYQEKGAEVILIGEFFQAALAEMARHVGADGAIGTRLEYKIGLVTGRIVGKACVSPRKLDFVRAYLQEHHPGASLADCAAYADSYADAALLAAVGHPVAVNPDKQLRAAALEQKWHIYETH